MLSNKRGSLEIFSAVIFNRRLCLKLSRVNKEAQINTLCPELQLRFHKTFAVTQFEKYVSVFATGTLVIIRSIY